MAANNAGPLGNGLSSLLSSTDPELLNQIQAQTGVLPEVETNLIDPNPYQPRQDSTDKIEELAASIRKHGILTPLLIAKKEDGRYQLVTGERRLTAAKVVGLEKVPVVIKDIAGIQLLEIAIIENIQRKDLNPMEESAAFHQLEKEFQLSHQAIAEKIGISEGVVKQRLNLLQLPEFVQHAISEEKLNMNQAEELYPLLEAPELIKVAMDICMKNQLSAKQLHVLTERLAAGITQERAKKINDAKTKEVEIGLTKLLGRKIGFTRTVKGGKITIPFNNDTELDEIYERLNFISYHL